MDTALRSAILDRARLQCEARATPSCRRTASSVHHRLTKARGGRLLDAVGETYHLMAICEPCHRHAHDSGQGHASGLLLRGSITSAMDGRPVYRGDDPYLSLHYSPTRS